MDEPLPPGQVELAGFPRFGTHLRRTPPTSPDKPAIEVRTASASLASLTRADLVTMPRRGVNAAFNCVAGWTATGLAWGGVDFAEVYDELIAPRLPPDAVLPYVTAWGADGWQAVVHLEDLRAVGVLIADELNGSPLSADHGAPWRLVSPGQYGFMSVKHLCGLTLHETHPGWPRGVGLLSPHPRARVALEERRAGMPGRLVRPVYRAMLPLLMRLVEAGPEGRRVPR